MNQNITTLKTGKEWVHIVSISLGPCELISQDKKSYISFLHKCKSNYNQHRKQPVEWDQPF